MRQHIYAMALAVSMLGMAGCDDDLEQLKVSELSASEMSVASGTDIVITAESMSKVVLQLTYTNDGNELYITNDAEAETALGAGAYVLEISTSEEFSSATTTVLSNPIKGVNDITYTGQALNILASSLGLEAGKAGKIYFRVAHSYTSDSLEGAVYSDVVGVSVTPLYIDMTRAFVLNKDQDAVTDTLYSASSNGIYTGFVGTAGGWTNFWVEDGLKQVWGNYGEDGNFAIADISANSAWNFWTGEPAGCMYLTLNTNTGSESIVYMNLQDMTVSGGAQASLSFDVTKVVWKGSVSTTQDNAELTISSATLTNDNSTGDSQASATAGSVTFSANADGTLVMNGAAETPVTVAKAGTYMLEVNLSGEVYTYKLTALGDVKMYPSSVVAKVGDVEVSMTAEMTDGLATGVYSVTVDNVEAGAALTFVASDGTEIEQSGTLANVAKYNIVLDLVNGVLTAEEVTSSVAETLGLYYDANCEWIQTTMYSGYNDDGTLSGIYQGLFYKGADDWNFYGKDSNGVTYGCNSTTWEQFTCLKDGTANMWVSAVQTPYFYTFDTNSETWSEVTVETIALTGDFNSWSVDGTKFVSNGDGTYTLSDVELVDEQWGPYIVLNSNWDLKLYIASDGKSLTAVNTGNFFATEGAGTYDIVVSALTNSVTITKK